MESRVDTGVARAKAGWQCYLNLYFTFYFSVSSPSYVFNFSCFFDPSYISPLSVDFSNFFLCFTPVADAQHEHVSLVLASNLRIQKVVGLFLGFLLPPPSSPSRRRLSLSFPSRSWDVSFTMSSFLYQMPKPTVKITTPHSLRPGARADTVKWPKSLKNMIIFLSAIGICHQGKSKARKQ